MSEVNDVPFEVTVESGAVLVDGPTGAITSLTSRAALETAGRLIDAAAEAHGQQVMTGIHNAETAKIRSPR